MGGEPFLDTTPFCSHSRAHPHRHCEGTRSNPVATRGQSPTSRTHPCHAKESVAHSVTPSPNPRRRSIPGRPSHTTVVPAQGETQGRDAPCHAEESVAHPSPQPPPADEASQAVLPTPPSFPRRGNPGADAPCHAEESVAHPSPHPPPPTKHPDHRSRTHTHRRSRAPPFVIASAA